MSHKANLENIILAWSTDTTGQLRDKLAPDALTLVDKLDAYVLQVEDAILDEKMQAIDKMISDFIGKRIRHPMADKAEIEEDPINYEPLVRQIRDYARGNAYGNRILDRAIARADQVIEILKSREANNG